LIETVIIYTPPRLRREEIQAMLLVHDIRETKVYQEAKEEGFQEGIEKGIERAFAKAFEMGFEKGFEKGIQKERQRSIARLSAKKMSAQEIADFLGVPIELVVREISKTQSNA
jgi:predicted transposase YdaD